MQQQTHWRPPLMSWENLLNERANFGAYVVLELLLKQQPQCF